MLLERALLSIFHFSDGMLEFQKKKKINQRYERLKNLKKSPNDFLEFEERKKGNKIECRHFFTFKRHSPRSGFHYIRWGTRKTRSANSHLAYKRGGRRGRGGVHANEFFKCPFRENTRAYFDALAALTRRDFEDARWVIGGRGRNFHPFTPRRPPPRRGTVCAYTSRIPQRDCAKIGQNKRN